ncbi:MAG: DUF3093 domain-containing protein [Propioniciclava sp.]|uniref:DUF3093 domain-containing protein n=1 Tax=Propioniciclava sp. TaxID=2038686 RepID=UPI0039E5A8C5
MEYRERLSAPAWYWLVGVAFGSTSALAMGLWFGIEAAIAGGLGLTALITIAIAWMGRTEIVVDGDGLRVGVNLLEWPWAGEVEALDTARARALLGVEANAAAFEVQRPWLGEAVRIEVADAADPHPYWFVSTRRPAQLAAAIERARTKEDS